MGDVMLLAFALNVALQAPYGGVDSTISDCQSLSGWSVQGNCWSKAIADSRRYGKQFKDAPQDKFLCTGLAGKSARGVAELSFKIERAYINLTICGGDVPGATCVNLIVDGKVVGTATGRRDMIFRPITWEVQDFQGKNATVQIVDAAIGDYGFVCLGSLNSESRRRDGKLSDADVQLILDGLATSYRREYRSPGIYMGIGHNGRVIATSCEGVRSLKSLDSCADTDILMLGSISKPVTGYVIARLVADGKLSWTDKFEDLCPNLVPDTSNASAAANLGQFMTHTSGIQTLWENEEPLVTKYTSPSSWHQDYCRSVLRKGNVGNPGMQFHYAGGVEFAREMAEHATHEPFDELMKRYIVTELELPSMGMGFRVVKAAVEGHHFDKNSHQLADYGDDAMFSNAKWRSLQSGGVSCNIIDATRFVALVANKGAKASLPHSFWKMYTDAKLPNSDYSLGGWGTWSGGLWHGGNTGRGEIANVQVLKNGWCLFAYFNMNYSDETMTIGELTKEFNDRFGSQN